MQSKDQHNEDVPTCLRSSVTLPSPLKAT